MRGLGGSVALRALRHKPWGSSLPRRRSDPSKFMLEVLIAPGFGWALTATAGRGLPILRPYPGY